MLLAKLARMRGEIAKVCSTSLRGANGSRECAPDDRLFEIRIRKCWLRPPLVITRRRVVQCAPDDRLQRVNPVFRGGSYRTEKPRRSGCPAFAGYDGEEVTSSGQMMVGHPRDSSLPTIPSQTPA
jgi:hypothetical protein